MSAAIAKPTNPSAHVDPKSAPLKEIPDVLVDPRTMRRYARGRFLGKGGFAKCYEITDLETKQTFAGKIVPKSLILKQHQREKMTSEIAIHKSLDHANIVGFHGFFEDDDFVFVVLEICRRRVSEHSHHLSFDKGQRPSVSFPGLLHVANKQIKCRFIFPLNLLYPLLINSMLAYLFVPIFYFSHCWSCTSVARLWLNLKLATTWASFWRESIICTGTKSFTETWSWATSSSTTTWRSK